MRRSKTSRSRDGSGEESIFDLKQMVPLDNDQWSYLERRYRLTDRELQVGKLACQGFTNKEIADNLAIRNGTVHTHLLNIYRKVRVTSKIGLLLKFTNGKSKSSVKPVVAPAIEIVETEEPSRKRPDLRPQTK